MKTKITIIKAETHNPDGTQKKTKGDRVFARFQTSSGWMSCFDGKVIEALKPLVGKDVVVDVVKTLDDNQEVKFQNINGIYPDGEQEEEDDFTDAVKRVDAQEAQAKAKPDKRNQAYDKDPVGLAVELLTAMISNEKSIKQELVLSQAMGHCIEAVKQARKEFS